MMHQVAAEERVLALRLKRNHGMVNAMAGRRQKADAGQDFAAVYCDALHSFCRFQRGKAVPEDAGDGCTNRQAKSRFRPDRRCVGLVAGIKRRSVAPLRKFRDFFRDFYSKNFCSL